MVLKNKLGISDVLKLAKIEETLSKKKAIKLFDSGYLDGLDAGTFASLAKIHKFLFDEIFIVGTTEPRGVPLPVVKRIR